MLQQPCAPEKLVAVTFGNLVERIFVKNMDHMIDAVVCRKQSVNKSLEKVGANSAVVACLS